MLHAEMIERISNGEFVYWSRFYMREAQAREMANMGAVG